MIDIKEQKGNVNMILKDRFSYINKAGEYLCELTDFLDLLIINPSIKTKHYLLVNEGTIKNKAIHINIFNDTVGYLFINDEMVVKDIFIRLAKYNFTPEDIEVLKTYIGVKLVMS